MEKMFVIYVCTGEKLYKHRLDTSYTLYIDYTFN